MWAGGTYAGSADGNYESDVSGRGVIAEYRGEGPGEKSHEYRLSPTIRQYALVSQDRPLVEIHTRGADGNWWISEVMGLESECAFSSLECSVPMAALYEGVLETGLAAEG